MSSDEAIIPPAPEHSPTAGPKPPRPVRAWLLGGLVGAVIGAGGVGGAWVLSGSGEPEVETFELTGTMTLVGGRDEIGHTGSTPCRGLGGYDDIGMGASVTVYDATGTAVATGALGVPTFDDSGYTWSCEFPVSVTDVPTGSAIYQVEVTHRGKISLKAAEAKEGRFSASLS
ncbi:hypothetical protein ACFY8W_27670 [Streptomyces sp. NPDC012637]|uniref:hypothetical protein n=1 Tax=Streptomyces sp. NPDC012637 TaxID=3364842 RepID=UPI0036E6531E